MRSESDLPLSGDPAAHHSPPWQSCCPHHCSRCCSHESGCPYDGAGHLDHEAGCRDHGAGCRDHESGERDHGAGYRYRESGNRKLKAGYGYSDMISPALRGLQPRSLRFVRVDEAEESTKRFGRDDQSRPAWLWLFRHDF